MVLENLKIGDILVIKNKIPCDDRLVAPVKGVVIELVVEKKTYKNKNPKRFAHVGFIVNHHDLRECVIQFTDDTLNHYLTRPKGAKTYEAAQRKGHRARRKRYGSKHMSDLAKIRWNKEKGYRYKSIDLDPFNEHSEEEGWRD